MIDPYPIGRRRRGGTPMRPLSLPPVPDNVVDFYRGLGCPFRDSKTDERITELTDYQHRFIRQHLAHRLYLQLKGQKMGISSLGIVILLWEALTRCAGYELVVIAQSHDQAKDHAHDARLFMADSIFRDYVITKKHQVPGLVGDELTKIRRIYLVNPKGGRPTRIHILSPSPGQVASLKRVKFIWASDITFSDLTAPAQEKYFRTLTSRLVMTEGSIMIECPTMGAPGPIYQIEEDWKAQVEAGIPLGRHDWFVDYMYVTEAIAAGVVTQEAIDAERKKHGPMFDALFMCKWFHGGNTWYKEEQFRWDTENKSGWWNYK